MYELRKKNLFFIILPFEHQRGLKILFFSRMSFVTDIELLANYIVEKNRLSRLNTDTIKVALKFPKNLLFSANCWII